MNMGQKSLLSKQDEGLGYKVLNERITSELVFALVEPIGGGAKVVETVLKKLLEGDKYDYNVQTISFSDLIENQSLAENLSAPELPEFLTDGMHKISDTAMNKFKFQQWGNSLRLTYGTDFLAKNAVHKMSDSRAKGGYLEEGGGATVAKPRRYAHILRSLKHPSEFDLLKAIYGDLLFLVGVSGTKEQQISNYSESIDGSLTEKNIEDEHDALSRIDQYEGIDHGQQVRELFYKADLFLSCGEDKIEQQLKRFLALLFGREVVSPTVNERMMFHAYTASLSSNCLSRQVGAAIVDRNYELLSIGYNDVPAFGGGLASDNDVRSCSGLCKTRNGCHSYGERDKLAKCIKDALVQNKLLPASKAPGSIEKRELAVEAIRAEVSTLIEFSRSVHAEMEAILSATRTSKVGIKGGIIYVTTYPCDNCVKHILAAGLKEVYYIEPYPKSRAEAFFTEFIADGDDSEEEKKNKIVFIRFVGIAPSAYAKVYKKWFPRKKKDGTYQVRDAKILPPLTNVYVDSFALYEAKIASQFVEETKKR